ncbi:MAG: DUF2335 domain-containing protein [Chitinophagales bacterium]
MEEIEPLEPTKDNSKKGGEKPQKGKNKRKENLSNQNEFIPIVEALEIPEEEKTKLYSAVVSIFKKESFSGPLPPPRMLKEYNNVIENGAERIMVMAEKQGEHRRSLESHAVTEQLRQSRYGQIFGFIIALLLIGVSTVLGLSGQPVLAGVLGGSTLVSLVTVFVYGKVTQKKELKEKDN